MLLLHYTWHIALSFCCTAGFRLAIAASHCPIPASCDLYPWKQGARGRAICNCSQHYPCMRQAVQAPRSATYLHELGELVVQSLAAHVPPTHDRLAQRGEAVACALQQWHRGIFARAGSAA